ncbi:histidine kinase [Kitasatospora sp. NPDC002965]|uniref:sensor histidine kinase n=1 Tax=Kitasatospora sp. NPDC002965 TaxID=3154775 RepID=UPI0033AAAAA6
MNIPTKSPHRFVSAPVTEEPHGETMPPRFAYALVGAVTFGLSIIGAVNLAKRTHDRPGLVSALLIVTCCFLLQLYNCHPRALRAPRKHTAWLLSLQAVLTFLTLPLTDVLSGSLSGFLGGAILIALRGRPLAWALYALVNVALLALSTRQHDGLAPMYLELSSLAVGLLTYGLSALCDLVHRQHEARQRAAWIAVSSERLRFSRDLHDLLGYSLSAITLKIELIQRLVGTDDGRAQAELRDTLLIARQALADVRAVATGPQAMSLARELRVVRGTLETAGVSLRIDGQPPQRLDEQVGTNLSIVMREAVTNLLRHSDATRCTVIIAERAGRVHLSVANNGVRASPETASVRRGIGLNNLRARLALSGGTVTTTSCGDWFWLYAECPVHPGTAGTGADGSTGSTGSAGSAGSAEDPCQAAA